MPPKSNVPIRICGSKVRSGCRTCKQRHLKCDEHQPICLRCQKADRVCVYGLTQSHGLQLTPGRSEAGQAVMVVASDYNCSLGYPILNRSLSGYGSHEITEINAVKVFTAYLGRDLAGCFSDDVWCSIIPRVAQREPSVWHAIVAVSLSDTRARLNHDDDESFDAQVAIQQYSKAMQELNIKLASNDGTYCKDVVLLCCVLFAVFECLQGRHQPALLHISGGMKLLRQWEHEANMNGQARVGKYLDHASLQPILLSLDSQAVQMGIVDFREYSSLPAMNNQPKIPTSFATVQEAHVLLNHIFNRISRWQQWVDPSTGTGDKPDASWMVAEKFRLQSQLAQWDSAFSTILELYHPQLSTYLLLLHRVVLQAFFLKSTAGPSEMEWDDQLPLFEQAIEYAEAYTMLTSTTEIQLGRLNSTTPILTVAMDLVLPLFLISAKCRHPKVRRQALGMLKNCKRREGIWDSRGCAMVAERIMEMEEAEALEDGHIPESARIYEIDLRLRDDRVGEISHKKLALNKDGSRHIEIVEEQLAW